MNDEDWAKVRNIFESRGVSRVVADRRPYVPYNRRAEWVNEDDGPFTVIPKGQRSATSVRDVNGSAGLVMYKNAVTIGGKQLKPYPPQIRPTFKPHHRHPEMPKRSREQHVADKHHGYDNPLLHINVPLGEHDHADMAPKAREDHIRGKKHHRQDVIGSHPDAHDPGKYKLPPSPLVIEPGFHEHLREVLAEDDGVEYVTNQRATTKALKECKHRPQCKDIVEHVQHHIDKWHGWRSCDADPKCKRAREHAERGHADQPTDGSHVHRYKHSDPNVSYGKRLDIHPDAVPLLEKVRAEGGTVYFSLEGNLKADAALTAILASGERASTFNVPSVAQWTADELEDFSREWLADARVFIVCDSDWADIRDVRRQAFMCREAIRRYVRNKSAVQVAAPTAPVDADGNPILDKWGDPVKVGLDDWLAPKEAGGCGGTLAGLVVVERETRRELRDWLRDYKGDRSLGDIRARQRNTSVIELLALLADTDGTGEYTLKGLSHVVGQGRGAVSKAIDDLAEDIETWPGTYPLESIESRPGLELERQQRYGPGFRYDDLSRFVVRAPYRWRDREPRRTIGEMPRTRRRRSMAAP